jgi:hypothetical protein
MQRSASQMNFILAMWFSCAGGCGYARSTLQMVVLVSCIIVTMS